MFFVILLSSTVLLASVTDAAVIDILYETVSATATVGLSRNLTASLSLFGKIIIIITMYFGRVGPISLAIALGSGNEAQNIVSNPIEDIIIG
jgi:trk system potassium uptake protein TrkH